MQVTCGDVILQVYNSAQQDVTMFMCSPDAYNANVNAAYELKRHVVHVPQLCCPPQPPLVSFQPPRTLLPTAAAELLAA